MTRERWPKVRELFERALECAPQERGGFVRAACGADAALREEVEVLLAAHEVEGGTLDELVHELGAVGRLWAAHAGPPDGYTPIGADAPAGEGATADAPQTSGVDRSAPDALLMEVIDGRYRLEAVLGSGGMGTVYRARHLQLERPVALKLVQPGLALDRVAVERFAREARAVARLKHPHIVTIHDHGHAPEVGAYLVMELLEGRSLRQELRARTRLPGGEAVALMRQVCAGVHAAHEAGIVHRDLKPENIFLDHAPGKAVAKVLDFGIAKLTSAPGSAGTFLTRAGAVLGTPHYMSPEQCRGEALDARSDVYALGCVLYELLTGRPPFVAEAALGVLVQHVTAPPEAPSMRVAGLWAGLDAPVLRALAKRREDRFATAAALAAALAATAEPVTGPMAAAGAEVETSAGPAHTTDETGAKGATSNNLPQVVTRFVGRTREIDEVRQLVASERLVTLTGPGGIGKTRLALEVARGVLGGFADGVWVVELAALADPALVPGAVAGALGVREEGGRAVADTLAGWLRERRALLVLDTCEHLVETCARLVDALLRGCPQVRVLATSREVLGVPGEAVWPVPALSVPASGAGAKEALASEAARLFVDRAALSKAGFTVSERNVAAVVAVCRRLEGMPLAIELAAARVKVLSVNQILARLDDRFRLLAGGGRTAPGRQQTLRATIDWSYELLTEAERVLLRRLSVFAGGWTLEAAERGCAGDDIEEGTVLEVLSRLVDKSLVVAHEQKHEVRYRMLETIHEYALERLEASGEGEALRHRHAQYFLALGEEAEPELLAGARKAEWLAQLEAEHENLRAALGWLLQHNAQGCLRLVAAVHTFWYVHGHLTEGRRWLEAALKRSSAGLPAPALVRWKAIHGVGGLARQQGDLEAARAYFEENLRISREAGDRLQIAWSSFELGAIAYMQGELRAARTYLEESLASGQEVGNNRVIAASLNSLGEMARQDGDLVTARSFYEQALAIFRQVGHQRGVSASLCNLGAVACKEGDLPGASTCYREALAIAQALGSKDDIAYSLDGLGAVATKRGAWKHAGRLAGAAAALREATGHELSPADRAVRERYLHEVRQKLGEAGLEAAAAEGRTLTLEQAVSAALEDAEA